MLGVVTDTFDYDAFGNLVARVGSTPNNYLYSGEQFDPDLNIYFQRARYYNQQRGRFLSMDPFAGFIDEPDTLHKYLYVGNDPSGLAEYAEYSERTKEQAKQTAIHHNKHGRDILCLTIDTTSIVLSIPQSLPGLMTLLKTAAEYALEFCACEFGGGPVLTRYGVDKESVGRLARKAAEAKAKLGVHGVSTTTKPTRPGRSALKSKVEEHFTVRKTGDDPDHWTVVLPEPVTQDVADLFNLLFGGFCK